MAVDVECVRNFGVTAWILLNGESTFRATRDFKELGVRKKITRDDLCVMRLRTALRAASAQGQLRNINEREFFRIETARDLLVK